MLSTQSKNSRVIEQVSERRPDQQSHQCRNLIPRVTEIFLGCCLRTVGSRGVQQSCEIFSLSHRWVGILVISARISRYSSTMRVSLPIASKFGSYRLFVKYSDTPILLVNQKVLTCRSCFDSYCFEYMSSIIDDVCIVVNDIAIYSESRYT